MLSGSMNSAHTVEVADIATESATLPSAQWVSRLEVDPPGAEPTSTTPMATRGAKSNTYAKPNDKNGMSTNCDTAPITKARRLDDHTSLTAPIVIVHPMDSATKQIHTTISTISTLASSSSPPSSISLQFIAR